MQRSLLLSRRKNAYRLFILNIMTFTKDLTAVIKYEKCGSVISFNKAVRISIAKINYPGFIIY